MKKKKDKKLVVDKVARHYMADQLMFVTSCGFGMYGQLWRQWSVYGKDQPLRHGHVPALTPKEAAWMEAKVKEVNDLLNDFSMFAQRLRGQDKLADSRARK